MTISVTITMSDDSFLGPIMAKEVEVCESALLIRVTDKQVKIFPFAHCYEYTIDYLSPPEED